MNDPSAVRGIGSAWIGSIPVGSVTWQNSRAFRGEASKSFFCCAQTAQIGGPLQGNGRFCFRIGHLAKILWHNDLPSGVSGNGNQHAGRSSF